ncbi:ATP-binding protein [Azohydromonas aeria]|uniref:ATP-binding protein n=1 Tax=Azohydromonas aeria TaxID=2590212 RepID=UPI0012F903FA|nr:ATP-binding protein [Azohydromonas aeria]
MAAVLPAGLHRGAYVAVSDCCGADAAAPAWIERRARRRRLHDRARAELRQGAPVVVVSAGTALAAALLAVPFDPRLWVFVLVGAVLWAGWTAWALGDPPGGMAAGSVSAGGLARRMTVSHAAFAACTALCLLALGLLAWWPMDEVPSRLLGLLLAVVALSAAHALAPLGPMAWLALLPPWSAALAQAWHAPALAAPALAVAALLSALLRALTARRRRRWRLAAEAQLALEEQLRAVSAERDRALRADADKTRFLANASHDLRQPVHAIGLFAATLEKRLRGSDDEPYVRNVICSIDALERSFNAMLDVTRLDAGTVEPSLQQFPLCDVFRRLYMQFAGQAELRGLSLRFAPGGKSVCSDPQLLERLLANLVQNALKYTERGGVVVVARTTASHVNIEVWDTGVGIGAAELPRVFDEFYQVGRSERTRMQGLGMGLAIVKRLAQLLELRLSVASQPGRGTVFRVGVPRGRHGVVENAAVPADTLPLADDGSRTVLVIEDEAPIREALGALLREWGHAAVVAASAQEAEQAQRALRAPPDLIVSDLHLGEGTDGIAAIAAVRRHWGCEVPAVLVTGDTSHQELRRATDSGYEVLVKPVPARKLLGVLRGLER